MWSISDKYELSVDGIGSVHEHLCTERPWITKFRFISSPGEVVALGYSYKDSNAHGRQTD
jgi:hypothetical protein